MRQDRAIMLRQDATNHVLIDIQTEHNAKLLGDSAPAPAPITILGLNNGRDQFRRRSLGTGFAVSFQREQVPVFAFHQRSMESEEGGSFQYDGRADELARTDEKCAEIGNDAIHRSKVGCAFTAPI